jgi:hypothetical protein
LVRNEQQAEIVPTCQERNHVPHPISVAIVSG